MQKLIFRRFTGLNRCYLKLRGLKQVDTLQVFEQGKFIQCVEYGMSVRHLPAEPPRKPLQGFNKDDKRTLEPVIRIMNTTINQIPEG